MKSIPFLVLIFIVIGFERILDATDRGLLKEVMKNNLEPATPIPELRSPIRCPKEVNISWLLRPPYTLERNDSDGQPKTGGLFHQALDVTLKSCCAFYREKKPNLRYLNVSSNPSVLFRSVFDETVSLVLPINKEDQNFIGSGRAYINIIDSPGVALILRNPSYSIKKVEHLFKAILGAWPIVVLSLLMSCLAGICIWFLDGKTNAKEFGSPSYRGAFDGFWWAFVTMSTVGYGDKTPKSTFARLFSVMWIMIGITICSMLTATLSSALTSVAVTRYDFTTGKTFGVQKGSFAFKQAVNLGINVTDFETLYVDADQLLENEKVEGIIEEMFTAVEFIKSKKGSRLLIGQEFDKIHGYGFVINKNHFCSEVIKCLKSVIDFLSDEILFNISTMTPYMETTSKQQMEPIEKTDESGGNIFRPASPSFQAMIIGMSVAVLMFITCSVGFAGARCLRQNRSNDLGTGDPKVNQDPGVNLLAVQGTFELKAKERDLEQE